MSTVKIFEMVASRAMSPEAGAELVMKQRTEATELRRPSWMPHRVFELGCVIAVMLLSMLGIRVQGSNG